MNDLQRDLDEIATSAPGSAAPANGNGASLANGAAAAPPAVSVVVPLHNEESTLARLYEGVRSVLDRQGLTFELVFIDDGSKDGSADALRALTSHDERVRAFSLRRNFGKAAALSTGFQVAAGRRIVTMDADLQDDPQELPRLLEKLDEGYGVVSGWKRRRRDAWTRRFASRVFNWATRALCGIRLHDVNCGLKAYTSECAREVADSCYGDLHRYLPVVAHWKGFRVAELPVAHHERAAGRSRYGIERYLRGFLDLLTTVFVSRYARRPMHVFGTVGLVAVVSGGAILSALVVQKLGFGSAIGHRPLLLLGAVLFLAGLQLLLAGLLAEMISRAPIVISRLHAREARLYPAVAIDGSTIGFVPPAEGAAVVEPTADRQNGSDELDELDAGLLQPEARLG
ncbi:MAG: glycosyltransferase family 2 protein [Actinomycetota bacterium]|nr:glycosyltransferase family 2 protein [Actinomycetota bacterium]